MKYYITDNNFNILSIHPDRESAKAVWEVNWKAGVDVCLESEEKHLENLKWVDAMEKRKLKRRELENDMALFLKNSEAVAECKPMSFEFEEAAEREALEDIKERNNE